MKSSMMGHVVDMAGLKMVQPPGLRSPKQRVTYASTEVQEHLCLAFGGILPWMQVIDDDHVRYLWDEGDGRDTCAESLPVESMGAIPKGEMLRLMEGWIMLRKLAQNPNLPPGMDAILLNFRIPDPRHAPEFYRVYRCAKTGRQRMHVLWGFEAAKKPSVLVDRAVAALFGVPVENIGSILATSFAAHGATEAVLTAATRHTTTTQALPAPATSEKSRHPITWVAAGLGIALVGVGGLWAGSSLAGGKNAKDAGTPATANPTVADIAPVRTAEDRATGSPALPKLIHAETANTDAEGEQRKSPAAAPAPSPTVGLDSMLLLDSPVSSPSGKSAPVSLKGMILSDTPPDAR